MILEWVTHWGKTAVLPVVMVVPVCGAVMVLAVGANQ